MQVIQHLLGLTTVGFKVHQNVCKGVLGTWPCLLSHLAQSFQGFQRRLYNMTVVLETKLLLAVGARVMLCCNIDTNTGLVNGAISTMVSVRQNHVTVQFDHINKLFNGKKVKSRFIISTSTGDSFH